ncbi:MAG: DUF433 domain-containing protein [Methylococcales bacterium]
MSERKEDQARAQAWDEAIVIDPRFPDIVSTQWISGGSPVIKGTRIEATHVWQLIEKLGWDPDSGKIEQEYPWLKRHDIKQAYEFVKCHPEFLVLDKAEGDSLDWRIRHE